jgi:hypothetical protein
MGMNGNRKPLILKGWNWWARRDSNPGPPACKEAQLPPWFTRISYVSIDLHQFGASAFAQSQYPKRALKSTFGTVLEQL